MKKVLITGGSSDIAFEMISNLAKEYEVTYTCSTSMSLESCAERYNALNVKGIVYNFASNEAPSDYDILILNACSKDKHLKTLDELKTDKQLAYISENLKGNLNIIKASLNHMNSNQFGRIVLISSLSTQMGTSKYSSYIMLKAALEGLIKNIAVDYASSNIIANTLRLGIFKTSRNKMIWKREAYQKKASEHILQAKMGEPASVILPLRSLIDDNAYLTGQEINIAGGLPLLNSNQESS